MVEQVVRIAVSVVVHEGRLEQFQHLAASMTEGSTAEPGTLGYEWFSHPDGRHFRLLETYVNAAAVEAHFNGPVVRHSVPELPSLCNVESVEIFGDPGPKVREMAGAMGAVFFTYDMGIGR